MAVRHGEPRLIRGLTVACATLGPCSRSADAAPPDRYEAVIGIEVHCQLKTASKMFCACSTAYDGAPPEQPRLPGLPRAAGRPAGDQPAGGRAGARDRRGDRRGDAGCHPLGPQELLLSGPAQGLPDQPVRPAARVRRDAHVRHRATARSRPGITRAHLEEDTAKLVHGEGPAGERLSLVDFNRSGVPLMEIVTEPDIRTAEQARRYAEELQLLLRTIGASDADMERGQLRVEANVSLRPRGTEAFGTRVEVKNMNSFRVRRAGDRVRDRAPGGRAGRRRAAAHGDARLVGRTGRDLPHAEQGDLRRLPLLPGAGPAAAARRRGVARRDPRGPGRASGRASGALQRHARSVRVRRRGPRRRRRRRPPVRGDARRRRRASRRSPSRTG